LARRLFAFDLRGRRIPSYNDLVAEAAEAAGLDRRLADSLDAGYDELTPWPDAVPVLTRIAAAGLPLGIVTNCSRRLGHVAASRIGVEFACVVTAKEAGFYKPDPRTYRLALEQLGVSPDRCLFVAGSAYDLFAPRRWVCRLIGTTGSGCRRRKTCRVPGA